MNVSSRPQTIALGLLGATIGGAIGYFVFFWAARQGFYTLILPPALLGLTAGYFARCRSVPLAIICAVAGLALGMYTEWRFAPFRADPMHSEASICDPNEQFFVRNFPQLLRR